MKRLTDEEIRDALILCEQATPGPWEACSGSNDRGDMQPAPRYLSLIWASNGDNPVDIRVINQDRMTTDHEDNAAFICAARDILPRALAELKELRGTPPREPLEEWLRAEQAERRAEREKLQKEIQELRAELARLKEGGCPHAAHRSEAECWELEDASKP